MKTAFFSFFCLLLVVSCKPIQVELVPTPLEFKTTCLLSKIQSFDSNLASAIDETVYTYDTQNRLLKVSFKTNDSKDSTETRSSIEQDYVYNADGYLTEIKVSGQHYLGYLLKRNLNPSAPVTGYTKYEYDSYGRLIKSETYQKLDTYSWLEFGLVQKKRKYEYDVAGNLTKYTVDDVSYPKTYHVNNGKVDKAETLFYGKYIVQHEVNNRGFITKENEPNDPSYGRVGSYKENYYDNQGYLVRQELKDVNGKFTYYYDYEYDGTPRPEIALPLLKGHPKLPIPNGQNSVLNKRQTSYILKNGIGTDFIKWLEQGDVYTKNEFGFPTQVQNYQVFYGDPQNPNYKTISGNRRYEYINCR